MYVFLGLVSVCSNAESAGGRSLLLNTSKHSITISECDNGGFDISTPDGTGTIKGKIIQPLNYLLIDSKPNKINGQWPVLTLTVGYNVFKLTLYDAPMLNDTDVGSGIILTQCVDEESLSANQKEIIKQGVPYVFTDNPITDEKKGKSRSSNDTSKYRPISAQSLDKPGIFQKFLNFFGCASDTYANENT